MKLRKILETLLGILGVTALLLGLALTATAQGFDVAEAIGRPRTANIDQSTGEAAVASALVPMWHGLGKVTDHLMTADEIVGNPLFDYAVALSPAGWQDAEGTWHGAADQFAITRPGTGASFGFVTADYKLVQNMEPFRALDTILQADGAGWETVGALRGGAQFFASAKLPEAYRVTNAPGDSIQPYVVAFTDHTGKRAARIFATSIRVVCQNTLAAAFWDARRRKVSKVAPISILHRGDTDAKLREAIEAYAQARAAWQEQRDMALRLADLKATDKLLEAVVNFTIDTFGPAKPEDASPDLLANRRRQDMGFQITDNIAEEFGLVGRTAWAVYNGATEFADHGLKYRGKLAADNRMMNILEGEVADYKVQLLDVISATTGTALLEGVIRETPTTGSALLSSIIDNA